MLGPLLRIQPHRSTQFPLPARPRLCEDFLGDPNHDWPVKKTKNASKTPIRPSHRPNFSFHRLSSTPQNAMESPSRRQAAQESFGCLRRKSECRETRLQRILRQLPRRFRQRRRLRRYDVRPFTQRPHRREAHELPHRRRNLLPDHPGPQANALLPQKTNRGPALATRNPRPLLRCPRDPNSSPNKVSRTSSKKVVAGLQTGHEYSRMRITH